MIDRNRENKEKRIDIADLVDVNEAADIIGVTVGRVRQLLIEERLQGVHLNKRAWMVYKKSAEKYASEEPATGRPRSRKGVAETQKKNSRKKTQ